MAIAILRGDDDFDSKLGSELLDIVGGELGGIVSSTAADNHEVFDLLELSVGEVGAAEVNA